VTTTTVDFLATVQLFNGLDRTELQRFADLTRERFYPRGSVILFENDPGDSLFVVRQGRVKVVLIGEDGREVILGVLGVGEHFGELSLARVILFAMAGAVLGDNLGFLIGRRGGRQFIDKFCGRFGLTPERLRQFDQFFDRHGPRTVFVARFVTGLRVFGAMLAGASRMHWRAFLLYNALGAFTWCVIIGLAGYTLGQSWQLLEKWVGRTGLIALAAIVAAVVIASPTVRRASR